VIQTAERVITLPRPHPGQQRVVKEAARFNCLACGRRWGKTTLGIDRLVGPALGGQPVAWFAPSYKMMSEVWRDVRRVFDPATERVNAQEKRLELVTGGVVDMWSLDAPSTSRGRRYQRVVVDEAAMVDDLEDAWNAVIRPTLVDFRGDAWFLSTPRGLNHFRTMYDRGQDAGHPEWASWQMPTLTNPYISPQEVEAARLMLPERTFLQEFEAMFLEDTGVIFRRVREAVGAQPQERAQEGHRYAIGVDWGKVADSSSFCVLDTTIREVCHLERMNQVDYTLQTGRLQALCERFIPDAVYAELNSIGMPIIEQLQRMGLPVYPFQTTNASKAQAVDALALAFERGELKIPDDLILIGQLLAYRAERLPSGLFRYSAPEGQHDDDVMALALAYQSLARQVTWTYE
jgi:Terminase RNaseH-like domain